jgi:hypothetical protein
LRFPHSTFLITSTTIFHFRSNNGVLIERR